MLSPFPHCDRLRSLLGQVSSAGLSSSNSHSGKTTAQQFLRGPTSALKLQQHVINLTYQEQIMNYKLKIKMYNQIDGLNQPAKLDRNIQSVFFKCTKWQLEETLDPINCPYHYYCNSKYPGDYSTWVDNLAVIFTAVSFIATAIFMVVEMLQGRRPYRLSRISNVRRYFLPSGPILLPIILVIMAKGYRINTTFPMSYNGPAMLQLVRISALVFETEIESDIKYVFLEASTISGLLHAALYLDSIILPYYTGLDALVSSTLSGGCLSCICRQQVLVVGGEMLLYRGWSVTSALVVASVIFRIFHRLAPDSQGRTMLMKFTIEGLSWVLMTVECLYLLVVTPPEQSWTRVACFGGIFVLICLQFLKLLTTSIIAFCNGKQNKHSDMDR